MFSRIFNLPDSELPRTQNQSKANYTGLFLDRKTIPRNFKALLCGPLQSGKTSLLFSLAISFAEQDLNVLYICPRKIPKLPLLPEGKKQPSSSALKRIQMVYLESKDEYLKYMSSVHVGADEDKTFQCVIVDDLDSYVTGAAKNEDVTLLARLLSYTVDAFTFIREQEQDDKDHGRPSVLVISITMATPSSPVIPRRGLYERWLAHILRIQPLTQGQDNRHFELSVLSPQGESDSSVIDAKYEVTDTHLRVGEVLL